MKILEIYKFLDNLSPFDLQESWDNSGLMIGDMNQDVKKIALSIDVDEELIDLLENDTLLITHHPIIFGGIKQLDFSQYPSNLIKQMIKKDISLISMHTNFDKTHLNRFVVSEVLGVKEFEIEEFFCYFDIDESFDDFLLRVKKAFKLDSIRYTKANKRVKRVALTTGSGGDLISSLRADCYLTGDLKYHQAFEAMENKISLIDIGHFESEIYFVNSLYNELKNKGILAIMSDSKNPFKTKREK